MDISRRRSPSQTFASIFEWKERETLLPVSGLIKDARYERAPDLSSRAFTEPKPRRLAKTIATKTSPTRVPLKYH